MGRIDNPNNTEWDVENETFQEYKERKTSHSKSVNQKNSLKKMRGNCPNTDVIKHKCKCRTCINRRNRAKGRRKQNAARKALLIPDNRFHGADAHEENWKSAIRIEVKAGKQIQPIATRFYKAKLQSDSNVATFGSSSKPFAMVAMPDAMKDGLFICQLSDLFDVMSAVLENVKEDEK